VNLSRVARRVAGERPRPSFEGFPEEVVAEFDQLLNGAYDVLEQLVGPFQWPARVVPLSEEEIVEGAARGAGHGMFERETGLIKIHPGMEAKGVFLNFLHENLHAALPHATEDWVDALTDLAFAKLQGRNIGERQ
jgi:hypothetical protein